MKKMIKYLMILFVTAFLGVSCTKSTAYDDLDARPSDALLYPTDGSALELYLHSTTKTNFEWVRSEGTQLYMVNFYAADKKSQLGAYQADNNGMNNSLQLSHTELSAIAERAGIAAGKSGDIYWNVSSNVGSQEAIAAVSNKLTITRFKSALAKPYRLYITGAGSEGGEDATQALPLKNNGNLFEIYTKISGAVCFVDRAEAGNAFRLGFNQDGEFTYGQDAVGEKAEGVYRITVDFQNSNIKFEQITSVVMMRANNNKIVDMPYLGKGVWQGAQQVALKWDGDERYRFLAQVDGKTEVWGSNRTDRDASEPSTILSSDDYYKINITTDPAVAEDSYGRLYKFWVARLKDQMASFSVHMTPERFFHNVKLDFDLTPVPVVSTLISPTPGQKLLLAATSGAQSEFKWETPAGNAPQLMLTTYKVVFSKDAEATQVLGSVAASWNTSVNVKHAELESIAAAAGIASATSGELYWSVQSSVEGENAFSPSRKIVLRRFVSLPTQAYITGAGSEFAAQYGAMHKITDEGEHKDKFEIYLKMTKGGKFDLTTSTDPSSDAFAKFKFKSLVTGGSFEEDGAADNTFTPESGVYRLIVDFNADTIGLYPVGKVYFVGAHQHNKTDCELTYTANGVWNVYDVAPDFHSTGWGGEDRCFFYMYIGGKKLKLGGNQKDSSEIKDPNPPVEGDSRWFVYLNGDESQWDWHLRLWNPYRNQNPAKKMNIKVNMNCGAFSHSYGYIDYLQK